MGPFTVVTLLINFMVSPQNIYGLLLLSMKERGGSYRAQPSFGAPYASRLSLTILIAIPSSCSGKTHHLMEYLIIVLQVIVGLSILNVWLVQNQKDTRWRGGDASTLVEEFHAYGLPTWSVYAIGFFKVSAAILLIAGIWFSTLIVPSALVLAFLLAGSITMHLKISDPLIKSFPAALFMVLSLFIAWWHYGLA